MKGVVEVYRGEEKILEESNMIMDNLGSQIAFWMSLPRGFGEIPSASAIYDTSNYTVRAASLGKDAAGYNRHAHLATHFINTAATSTINVTSISDTALSYDVERESTYFDSTLSATLAKYNVLPEDSNPAIKRLETKSTKVLSQPNSYDVGHNLNMLTSGTEKLGCYAPSGIVRFSLKRPNASFRSFLFTRNQEGYNSPNGVDSKAIDNRGFIRVNVKDFVEGRTAEQSQHYYSGLLVSYDSTYWDPTNNLFSVNHVLGIDPRDVVCLNFFGGVYTIGLWGFDIKKMMDKGMYPPYQQYPIDDIEYKLYARKTFTKDITKYDSLTVTIERLIINWRFNFI